MHEPIFYLLIGSHYDETWVCGLYRTEQEAMAAAERAAVFNEEHASKLDQWKKAVFTPWHLQRWPNQHGLPKPPDPTVGAAPPLPEDLRRLNPDDPECRDDCAYYHVEPVTLRAPAEKE